jgi:hypothetical protein
MHVYIYINAYVYSYNIFTHIEDTYHYNKCSTITALHSATNARAVYSSDTKLVNITTELHLMWHGGYILQKKQSIHTHTNTYRHNIAHKYCLLMHARTNATNNINIYKYINAAQLSLSNTHTDKNAHTNNTRTYTNTHTQHNYRLVFHDYIEEKRYRMLVKQQTLERNLRKQDRILAIHKGS